eukprot:13102168-Alexandrium_andersonii.AAC.1
MPRTPDRPSSEHVRGGRGQIPNRWRAGLPRPIERRSNDAPKHVNGTLPARRAKHAVARTTTAKQERSHR